MTRNRTTSKGVGLLSLLPAVGILSVAVMGLGVGLRHDGRVKKNLEGSLNYIRSEDTVRTTLGATLVGFVALKKFACNQLTSDLEGEFNKAPEAREAEPPARMEFKKVDDPSSNPGCHPELKATLNTPNTFYFCLDVSDWDTKIMVGTVEAKYELVNLVDESPMDCADFQAKTETPVAGVSPGAKVSYRITWKKSADAGDADEMSLIHPGYLVGSALP